MAAANGQLASIACPCSHAFYRTVCVLRHAWPEFVWRASRLRYAASRIHSIADGSAGTPPVPGVVVAHPQAAGPSIQPRPIARGRPALLSDLTPVEAVTLYMKMRRAFQRARWGWGYAPPNLMIMFDCDDVMLELELWQGTDVMDGALRSRIYGGRHRAA